MKKIMNAKVCVPVILILIACIAYATWSWVGATAWCSVWEWNGTTYLDTHASVGWGGMKSGGWSTYAAVGGLDPDMDHGDTEGSGGGSANKIAGFELSEPAGSASASIGGLGADGNFHYDANGDYYPEDD